MRLTAILLLTGSLAAGAKGFTQNISISEKNVPIEKVFKEIEKQTSFTFWYNVDLLKDAGKVTVIAKNSSVEEVLKQCFANQPLTYSIVGNTIIVKLKTKSPNGTEVTLSGVETRPPPIDIHGRILNEKGEPVIASVQVKGTNKGTTTNDNGEFELKGVDDNATLVISGVSIETFEMKVNGRSDLVLNAKVRVESLNEVVINKGYYRVRQRENTGDVYIVNGSELQKQPVTDPIAALQGKVPGLFISQQSGVPGAKMASIKLRGLNSIAAGTDPLFVVDGIPFTSKTLTSLNIGGGASGGLSPFANLDLSAIESIEVLKDADATAIYGSRGANGVIIITTKKGKSGDTKIDFDIQNGWGKVTTKMDLLNTKDYLLMRHEAFLNDGTSPQPSDYDVNGTWDTTSYTDWQKVLIGNTSHFNNAQFSISGGNENTQFLFGGGYSRQTTVFPGDFVDKMATAHFNINHLSSNKKFQVVFSGNYSNDNNLLPTTDLTSLITLPPDAPKIYNSSGDLNWQNNTWTNPFGTLLQKATAITDNLIGNLNLKYELVKGLSVRANLGYNKIQMNQNITSPLASYPPSYSNLTVLRKNLFANNELKTWIVEPQIAYDLNLNTSKIAALIGTSFQENNQNLISQIASNFSSDALINNISAASSISVPGYDRIQYKYNGAYARVGYTLKGKYLLNFTGRRDGSTKFGSGFQFGNFGAIGAGWIFSDEHFVQSSLPFISSGKIRASYGTAGNDQISDYQYLSSYRAYNFAYQGTTGLFPARISNPFYHWEEVKKLEVGFELGCFSDRIALTLNYYRNRTGNQLVGYSLPTLTGFNSVTANLPAVLQNSGFEFQLNTVNVKYAKFSWESAVQFTVPRNKLLEYPNLTGSSYANRYVIGEPLDIKKLYHFLYVDPITGLYIFQDANSDGQISNPQDLQAIKKVTQDFFGSFQNSFSYKTLHLDLFLQFVKQTGYNYFAYFNMPGIFNFNQPTIVLSRWQKTGTSEDIEKFSQNYGSPAGQAWINASSYSDKTIGDASFIRLRNVALSYDLPIQFQKRIHFRNARIYVHCENLFTLTKYKGLDPETSGNFLLPPLRMISTGIQFSL